MGLSVGRPNDCRHCVCQYLSDCPNNSPFAESVSVFQVENSGEMVATGFLVNKEHAPWHSEVGFHIFLTLYKVQHGNNQVVL